MRFPRRTRDPAAELARQQPTADVGHLTRAQAGRDIAGQLVFRIVNLGLGLVTTIVLVRSLGDQQFGQWVTIASVMGLAGSFGLRGISNVAVERAASEPPASAMWVGALVTLRLALSPVVTFASLAVCLAVADSHSMRVAAVVVHTVFVTAALSASRVVFQLRAKNAVLSAVELASGTAWGAAVLIVAATGPSLLSMAIAFVVVTNVTNVVVWFMSRREHPIRLRGARTGWRPLVVRGLPVALASIVALGYGQIDQVLVFQLAGSGQAGLYGAAYRIYDRLQIFPAALMTTLFPVFVAARDTDIARVRKVFNTAIDYLVLASLPAFTIALAGPEPLCVMLFGDNFAGAAPALPVLMASLVVVSLGYLTGYLIISYSLQRVFIAVALLALLVNVAANLIFIPQFGFIAAAWTTLATEMLVLALSMTMLCRRIGVLPFGHRLPRIGVAAAAVGFIAWGGRLTGAPPYLWASVAAASYLPMLMVTRSIQLRDAATILSRKPPTSEQVEETMLEG